MMKIKEQYQAGNLKEVNTVHGVGYFCTTCYFKIDTHVCEQCDNIIKDQKFITIHNGTFYHENHFMCFKCGEIISKNQLVRKAYVSNFADDNSEESLDSGSIEPSEFEENGQHHPHKEISSGGKFFPSKILTGGQTRELKLWKYSKSKSILKQTLTSQATMTIPTLPVQCPYKMGTPSNMLGSMTISVVSHVTNRLG